MGDWESLYSPQCSAPMICHSCFFLSGMESTRDRDMEIEKKRNLLFHRVLPVDVCNFEPKLELRLIAIFIFIYFPCFLSFLSVWMDVRTVRSVSLCLDFPYLCLIFHSLLAEVKVRESRSVRKRLFTLIDRHYCYEIVK